VSGWSLLAQISLCLISANINILLII